MSVGLDVHARSVAAAAIDSKTGELHQTKLTPQAEAITAWIDSLPGSAAACYEAGPTGFGLYRHLKGAEVRCVVAAPSKLQRPSGDRVKTDAKDAAHMAKLLRLGEITEVRVPTIEQEAARDLVRAREQCRADLMRVRHRLSKLLRRHGLLYSGGSAWTGKHDLWLRRHAGPQLKLHGTQMAFDSNYGAVLETTARRDRLEGEIATMAANSEYTDVTRQQGCLGGSPP